MRSDFRKIVDGPRCVPIQSCAILCVNEVDCHRERTSTRSVPTKPMTSHFGACCFQRAVPKVDTNDIGSKNAFRPTRSMHCGKGCAVPTACCRPYSLHMFKRSNREEGTIHHASTWYILCLSRKAVRDIASHAYFTTRGWRGNTKKNNLHSSTRMKKKRVGARCRRLLRGNGACMQPCTCQHTKPRVRHLPPKVQLGPCRIVTTRH